MNNSVAYFKSSGMTIVSFPAFSGGKFLINCLSLSKGACVQDSDSASYLLDNPTDYQYRLQKIMTTLPDCSDMKKWRSYEFGDLTLYGAPFIQWSQGKRVPANDLTIKLCRSGMKFFVTDHDINPPRWLLVWPNASVIVLVNYRKFQCLSIELKSRFSLDSIQVNGNYCEEKYRFLSGPSWPSWQTFEKHGYDVGKCNDIDDSAKEEMQKYYYRLLDDKKVILFDVDSCIFDQNRFLTSMENLYQNLSLDDFNADLISCFYQKYIDLHRLN